MKAADHEVFTPLHIAAQKVKMVTKPWYVAAETGNETVVRA